MNIRTVLLLLGLAGIAVFAAVNWAAFTAPTTLSLLVTTIEAPLGLIMLGVTAMLAVLLLGFATYLQTTMLLETRSHAREMQVQRKLADQAEASRLTELQNVLTAQILKLDSQTAATRTEVLARIDQLEQALSDNIEQGGNVLAAYIGELEDRIERGNGILTAARPS